METRKGYDYVNTREISDQEIDSALEQGKIFAKNVSIAISTETSSDYFSNDFSMSKKKPNFGKGSAEYFHVQFLKPKMETVGLANIGMVTSYAALKLTEEKGPEYVENISSRSLKKTSD